MEENLVKVKEFGNPIEANLTRSRFEAEGIWVFIAGEHLYNKEGHIAEPLVLMVRKSDYAKAVGLLMEIEKEIRRYDEARSPRCPFCMSTDIYIRRVHPLLFIITFILFLVVFTGLNLPYDILPLNQREIILIFFSLMSVLTLIIIFYPKDYVCRKCLNVFRTPVPPQNVDSD